MELLYLAGEQQIIMQSFWATNAMLIHWTADVVIRFLVIWLKQEWVFFILPKIESNVCLFQDQVWIALLYCSISEH